MRCPNCNRLMKALDGIVYDGNCQPANFKCNYCGKLALQKTETYSQQDVVFETGDIVMRDSREYILLSIIDDVANLQLLGTKSTDRVSDKYLRVGLDSLRALYLKVTN